jgi:DNA invertase Pin-like site-specific DNA recombinase
VSLDAQEEKIKAYCTVKSWELEGIYRDEGISGKSLDRPGIQEVLRLIEKKEVEALIVYKIDRLTRSVKDLNFLIELFEKKNFSLVSLQESLDATTATGRLMMNLLASVSQWEREVIGERTKMAMNFLRQNKKVYSRPVYGFDIAEGQLVENHEEQEIIRLMMRNREEGFTYEEIASYLERKGIKTKRGGIWKANTVRKILNREVITVG